MPVIYINEIIPYIFIIFFSILIFLHTMFGEDDINIESHAFESIEREF